MANPLDIVVTDKQEKKVQLEKHQGLKEEKQKLWRVKTSIM